MLHRIRLQCTALLIRRQLSSQAAQNGHQVPILSSIESYRKKRAELVGNVGFVPTMGALHEGHLELFRRARAENDFVVASIFVNPTQFGPHEDFDKYPRRLEQDIALLKKENLVDVVFAPTREIMYGPHHCVYVDPHGVEALAEGAARPGFFRGVLTVVSKLFNVVQPTRAYFGQKDALQCVMVKRLVHDLDFPIQIRIMPTSRDPDGLAMSSRNVYLTPEERKIAPIVYRSLQAAKLKWEEGVKGGTPHPATTLASAVKETLAMEPLVTSLEYVSIGSKETMKEIKGGVGMEGAVVSVALKVGNVRLIDNIVLGHEEEYLEHA